MSLLDAINDRISQLQAATDANYKAAGYEVPTSAQRKAAELTGQNPYEYATQLKQIETAQKEAEKAAKAAQKQAQKAARQSSSRSSSGSSRSSRKSSKSSQSSNAESTSAPSGNTGAMSSLFGSESETIPSIKDSEQTKKEAAKAVFSGKKDTASKLVQASTTALKGVKLGNKKSENNVKSTSTTSTPKAEESSAKATSASNKSKTNNQNTKTSGGKKTVATQLAQVSVQALKGVKPKASDKTSQTETIPQYDPFPQGSMPKTLYDIRNAEMADLKVQQDKINEVNQLVNQYRQEAAAKGVDLDAELAKMNDYTGENKSIEELAVELDMEKHPEKYSQDSSAQEPQSVKIDSTNVKDYLDPDRYLEDYEVEAAKNYIDEYKKTHEGFDDYIIFYNIAPDQVARYNRENGTNYSLRDYLTANGVSMDEYQEALSVQALEQKLSNAGAFAAGFTRKESNMANLPDRIGDLITGGAISRGKADIERNATEAEKAAMFYSDLEKSRREKTTKAQETQSPLAYGAGSLTRMVYDTALTKGIGDALLESVNIPALNSSNPVVKNLAEIGLDTALVDIPTDTVPEIIENYNNGMPMDEIAERAGWNIAGNVGINALMDWAIPSYISNMGKEATQQAEKEAAQYAENLGISTPFDLSSENINALIPSINNADNLSRQLQDSLNNQIEEPIRSVTDIPGAEPITVRQDIEGLQNQWDDYLKDISNETPGSLEVRAPKLDDYLQRTYESYMDDLAKATSTDDIVEIMQKATLDLRAGSLSEEQFQNLIKVAQGDAAVDTAAGVVGDTVASNVMRTGLDTIHPEHGVSVGEMVTQLTDDMRTSVDDFGTKYADLLNKNENIRTKYDNLSKAVDDFNNAALHTDENLDDYYRKIDATRKNLQRNLKKVDEGASKDVIFSNSKNGVIKRADQARYHIKNDITINDPNEAMDWLPGFEGMTRSEMEDSAKDLFAEEAPRNIPIEGSTAKMTYEDYINSLNKSNNPYVTDDIFKNAYQSYKSGDLSADDLRRLVAKENYADPSHKISDGEFVESLWHSTSQAWPEALRKGMDTIDPNTNRTIGEVVQGLVDDIKASEEAIRELYPKSSFDLNALSIEVGHFTHDALLTDKNLDRSYEIIESYLDNLQAAKSWDVIKLDKAEAELFSNYRNNILEKADQVRNYVNSIDTADTAARNIPNGTTSSLPEGATPDNLKLQTINGKKGKMYQVVSENGNVTTPVERKVYKSKAAAEEALNKYKSLAGSGSKSVPGANPMQFFGGGKTDAGDWKTGKWRTNTAEKTGKIKNSDDIPVKDYAYHVFTEEAQKEVFDQRYADVDDVVGELLKPDHPFDEVDVRGAQQEWAKLMDAGDEQSLKKANRLGRKIASETREGGRVVQALAESTRNTPEGQLRTAQKAVNEIVDKQVGEGTSESLDNLVRKIEDAYENSKGDKEAFKKQVEELMQGDIKQYASKTKAKKMSPKKISGKTDVLKMIEDGADIDDIAEVVYKQNGGIRLTPEDQKTVYDYLVKAQQEVEGSYAQEELLARAAKIVQAKTPSTVGDKVRSILYNNMLGNFKTAISRNAFGNLAYQGIEQARQPITAFVDKLVSLKTGQHSALGWNKGKASAYAEGFKKGAKEQLTDISKRIDTGRSGAKGWAEALRNNATTWDDTKKIGQFANSVNYYVRNAMELGDRPFYEANYKQAFTEMSQMLDRYGQSGVYGLADVPESDVYEVMDMIASVRAADSVFQKHGKMSKGLTELRNGLGDMSRGALGVDILSTQSTPFTMTPGNMLERAIEYTPLGVVKNTAETLGEVLGRKGFNQRRFVDEASRTITGIPMLWAAYELANNTDPESVFGSINGSYSEDPDEKAAQREDGYIEYGYNVPNWVPYYGGKTLDTSDLPVIGPMMQAGARMAEEGIENPRAWAQAAESIFGGSTTQGLRRLFGSDTPSYSGSQSVMDNVLNTIGSSGSQLVPSLMRQTAQTTDPYKRDLGEYGTAEYYYNMLLNNIPGLRQTLPVKTDVEGQPVLQNQGRSLPEKILENYILPMNVSDYDPSTLNTEASRLYNETGSAIAFTPQVKRSDLRKVDEKQGVEYSEEQFREYKENLGNLNSTMGNALIESDYYKSLSAEEQAKALQDVYTAMKAVANYNATKAETDNKIANAYMEGQEDAAIKQLQLSKVLSDYNISSSSKIVEDIAAAVTAGNYDEAVQIASQYREATDYLKDNGITNNEKNREMYNSGQATELEDSEEAKRILKDAGYGFGENSYTRDLYNEGGLPAVQGYIDDMNAFTNAGVDASNDLYKDYQAAAQYWQSQGNGDLTATQFANSVKVLDTDKSSHVSQAEVIAYANENGLSEAEVNQLWGLYGSEWSYVPYVTNKGTWAAHKGS